MVYFDFDGAVNLLQRGAISEVRRVLKRLLFDGLFGVVERQLSFSRLVGPGVLSDIPIGEL